MSVTLLVRLKRPVSLADLEKGASGALRELLNLDYNPSLKASFDEADSVGDPSSRSLTRSSRRVACSILGYEERVVISPFTVPVQMSAKGDSYSFVDQDYVSVGWHFKRTALCWALVAAVAVGVAREEGSEIEDNSGFFTTENVQPPDDFCAIASLKGSYGDLVVAAEAFYAKLPKSAEIAAWLQSDAASDS